MRHGNRDPIYRDGKTSHQVGRAKKMSILKSTTVWSGNTYPIREAIKSLGGKWDATRKVWIVPALSMRQRSAVYSLCGGLKGVRVDQA